MRQGNVFTPVCHSVHNVICSSACWDTHPPGRQPLGRYPPLADGYCCGRYYNAFVFFSFFTIAFKKKKQNNNFASFPGKSWVRHYYWLNLYMYEIRYLIDLFEWYLSILVLCRGQKHSSFLILEDISPFWRTTDTRGLLVTSPLGFKTRVGSLICPWWRRTCSTFQIFPYLLGCDLGPAVFSRVFFVLDVILKKEKVIVENKIYAFC